MARYIRYLIISICCVTVFLISLATFDRAQAQSSYVFTQPLTLGITSPAVIELQKILNSNPLTVVATTGLGSSGHETSYFGLLTQQAVIKFQNLYPLEILNPAGLSTGNGFVGPLTLKKLNALISSVSSSSQSFLSTSGSQNTQQISQNLPSVSSQVVIYGVNPYEVKPGDTIMITGLGFTATNNTISLGSYTFPNLTSQGTQISLTLPSTIALGTYEISEVSSGISAKKPKNQDISVIVTAQPLSIPTIASLNPTIASENDTLTLTGTGFTSHSSIITPLGSIMNLSSADGKTLQFKPSELSHISEMSLIKQNMQASIAGLYIPVSVVTEAGQSKTTASFILK